MDRICRVALLVILSISLVIVCSGMVVDTAQWSRSKEWTVANGADTCSITLEIGNNTNASMDNYLVEFSIDNSIYGTLNPASSYTISNKTSTIFTSKYKSGTAIVTGKVLFKENDSDPNEPFKNRTWSTEIKIDHDTPFQRTSYSVPSEMEVGSSEFVRLVYTDQWGNPVDNRRITEQVYFQIGYSPNNTALFVGASPPYTAISIPVDSTGNATAQFQASTAPGPNMIIVHPEFLDQQDDYFYINAIANSSPVAIEQQFDPDGYLGNPPKQYADGISLFQIVYTLKDQYGNGVMNSPISISTTIPGEEVIIYTNAQGKAMLTYGPKSSTGRITLTAKSQVNELVICSKEIVFISQEPVDMQFTAIPDTMPSRDVETWEPGELKAKVIDINGNPVEGELVNFSLGEETYPDTYNVTEHPELTADSAYTDSDGYAIVYFLPGAFTTDWGAENHSDTATGSIPIIAHWENYELNLNETRNVTVSWKNYPYLSLETKVFPQTVNVTDTVDVWIKLKGDGWALQPKPIDVLLLLDNSGSMGTTDAGLSGGSALSQSKRAAVTFINQMEQGKDRVGVIFYDKKTYPDFSVYVPLTYDLNSVINAISSYSRSATKGYHTRTRYALYEGIRLMNQWNNRKAVRAIIHMTDGQWSMEGDPLARGIGYNSTFGPQENIKTGLHSVWAGNVVGVIDKFRYFDDLGGGTANYGYISGVPIGQSYDYGSDPGDIWEYDRYESTQNTTSKNTWYFNNTGNSKQNMSVYAADSKLKVFSIGFTSSANYDNLKLVLSTISNATGGFYQYAPDEAALTTLYSTIAGQLKTEAGVDTEVALNFEDIEVNYEVVTVNETYKVFDYVPMNPDSTRIDFYDTASNTSLPGYPTWVNQSDQWYSVANPYHLQFSPGTIKLGQNWEARYTLRVLTDGNINVFGPGSTITFNNGEATLLLPKTYITGIAGMVSTGVNTSVLNITNVSGGSESDPQGVEYMVWTWDRHYTGVMNVTEQYFISNDGGMQWILIGSKNLSPEEANQPGEFRYQKNLLPAGVILFKVVANAEDAPGPVVAAPPPPETAGPPTFKPYIVLK